MLRTRKALLESIAKDFVEAAKSQKSSKTQQNKASSTKAVPSASTSGENILGSSSSSVPNISLMQSGRFASPSPTRNLLSNSANSSEKEEEQETETNETETDQ